MYKKRENVLFFFGLLASIYVLSSYDEHWSNQSSLKKTIEDLDLQINFDLEYYADKVTNPELLVKGILIHQNFLKLKLNELNSWNTYQDVALAISLGYLTFATYIAAKAAIKVASNPYTLWQNNALAEKNYELLQRFDDLSSEKKEALVKQRLAFKDSKNEFFLHYICPISLSIIVNPVIVSIEEKPDCFKLELYEKSSIIAFLENTNGSPLSPISRLPLTKRNNQYWTKPNEEIISDHANYLKNLKDCLNNSVMSSATRTQNP